MMRGNFAKIIAILALSALGGVSLSAEGFIEGNLEPFINSVYNQDPLPQVETAYARLLEHLSKSAVDTYRSWYQGVALHYYMARAYQFFPTVETCIAYNERVRQGQFLGLDRYYDRREAALLLHEKAFAALQQLKERFSDAYEAADAAFSAEMKAMEAEIITQLCLFKSVRYSITHFPKIGLLCKAALKKDGTNPRALLLSLSTPVYSVSAYGGDAQKGLAELNQIDPSLIVRREDEYNYHLSYGYAYMKLGELDKATESITAAAAFYPNAVFPKAMLQIIKEGGF